MKYIYYLQSARAFGFIKCKCSLSLNVPEYPLFHYQPYELALSSKLVDMVKLYKIEILHVHYAIPHAYAGYMAKQMLKVKELKYPWLLRFTEQILP
jgi:hypothetical protein